jgi:hypothetical protein
MKAEFLTIRCIAFFGNNGTKNEKNFTNRLESLEIITRFQYTGKVAKAKIYQAGFAG